MKTTLEIPDATFRRAKTRAAARGIPLRQFVTEAVEEKLRTDDVSDRRPWLKLAGGLKRLQSESRRVRAAIEREFEVIEAEDRM